MAGFRQIARSSFIYTLLAFLPTASRILLLPVFLLFLSPEDFAFISLNTLIATVLPLFMTLGLDTAFARFYYDFNRSEKMRHAYFSTIVLTITGISLLIGLLLIPFGSFLFKLCFTHDNLVFFPFGLTAVLSAMVSSVNSVFMASYRNRQQLSHFTFFSLGYFLASTISETIAILVLKWDVMGIIYLKLICTSAFSLFVWATHFTANGIRFNARFLPSSFRYSLPLVPYSLANLAFLSFDRIMIENYFSLATLAVYNLASAIANITESIMFAIQSATYPTVYEMLKKGYKETLGEINKIYRLIGVGVLFILALLMACSPPAILFFLRPLYAESLTILPLILASFCLRYLYIVYSEPLFFFKRTSRLPWLNILLGSVTILGNVIFLPLFGLPGAASIVFIARSLQLSLTYYWYQRASDLRFDLSYLPGIIVPSIALMFGICLFNQKAESSKALLCAVNCIPLLFMILFSYIYLFKGQVFRSTRKNLQVLKSNI